MIPLAEVLPWLMAHAALVPHETVPAGAAAGRVLALPLPIGPHPRRALAAIDGQAVSAATTQGASDYAPMSVAGTPVRAGDPMPLNADAVLPPMQVENGASLIAVAVGSGVIPPGHDASPDLVLAAGTLLRPVHLALLHGPVAVVRRPRVALRPGPDGDAGPMLHALVAAEGAIICAAAPDLVLGTSRDPGPFTAVFADGIAVRPGETAIIGLVGSTPALHLPGRPLDVATVFALLAAPTLQRMGGRPAPPTIPVRLTRKITSALGQVDAIRVRVTNGDATPLGPAEGGSLAAGAAADGLVLVPAGCEGYPSGTSVAVHPLPR